ncbi:hypothetical protein FO519_009204 [Halicephalobus sp. NKZ332]|nr:hypothetical protein FO519_009204 [Halicephalobus sp. NKZ332]
MIAANATIDYDAPDVVIISSVRSYFTIVQCIGAFIEVVFFFIMIRDWCRKNAITKSAFFYLFTLKTFNNFVYLVYWVLASYFYVFKTFFYITYAQFFTFNLEVDTLSEFFIALNRFTALMIPLKHDRIWTSTVTFRCLILIPCLAGLLIFGWYELASLNFFVCAIISCFYRVGSIMVSMIITLIPTIKSLCQSKPMYSSNPTLHVNALVDANLKKQKAERQLLYITVFISFWKTVNIAANTVFFIADASLFSSQLMSFITDFSTFTSNVGGLIILLVVSNVARKAFKQAFGIEKNEKSVSISTVFSTVKNQGSPK